MKTTQLARDQKQRRAAVRSTAAKNHAIGNMNMTPWSRLDDELNRRKLGWQWVANGLQFNIQRVHNWKSRGVPATHFRALADLFNVTVDWIEGFEG